MTANEYREIIRNLLRDMPDPRCSELSHRKPDRHGYDEPCPVEARLRAAIESAETAMKETGK